MAKKLMKGCEAIAEAAVQAGCRFFFGYPITPQNDIPEYMSARMPQVGGCFLQAESEVAAINMLYGAAGAGARVMTTSSSPGISLMMEGVSYIAGAELPCVIVNVVRGGPGLGSIMASQGDYFQATKGGGHGDYHCVVYAPHTVQEAIDLMLIMFDVADRYRTPVMMVADAIIGQMMEPVEIKAPENIQVVEKPWATTGYDPNGTRPRAIVNSLYIEMEELEAMNLRLQARYREIEQKEVRSESYHLENAEFLICAYGTVARICKTAIDMLEKQGVHVGMVRPITIWPFPKDAVRQAACAPNIKKVLTIEVSAGQMVEDVRLAISGAKEVEFFGTPGSRMPSAEDIVERVLQMKGV